MHGGRPVAWLSADERDNDPATLMRGVAAAIDRAVGLDPGVVDVLAAPGLVSGRPRCLASARRSQAPGRSRWSSTTSTGSATARRSTSSSPLAGYLGTGSRFAVAGRGPGRFPVARLASRGQLGLIDGGVLALDLGETRAVVEAAGLDLSDRRGRDASTTGPRAGRPASTSRPWPPGRPARTARRTRCDPAPPTD